MTLFSRTVLLFAMAFSFDFGVSSQIKTENFIGTSIGAGSRWPFLGYMLSNQDDYFSPILPKSHNLSANYKKIQMQIGYVFPNYELIGNENHLLTYNGKGFSFLLGYRYFQKKRFFIQSFAEYAWSKNTRKELTSQPISFNTNRYSISTDFGLGFFPFNPQSYCESGRCRIINLEFAIILTYSAENNSPIGVGQTFTRYATFGISTKAYIAFWNHSPRPPESN
jgi:hypothetical protein